MASRARAQIHHFLSCGLVCRPYHKSRDSHTTHTSYQRPTVTSRGHEQHTDTSSLATYSVRQCRPRAGRSSATSRCSLTALPAPVLPTSTRPNHILAALEATGTTQPITHPLFVSPCPADRAVRRVQSICRPFQQPNPPPTQSPSPPHRGRWQRSVGSPPAAASTSQCKTEASEATGGEVEG